MDKKILLGPPGTGKTHWMTKTVGDLMHLQVDPQQICAVTFTKVAAREIRERIHTRFPSLRYDDFPWVGTIHSLCRRLLGHPVDQLFAGKSMAEFSKAYHYNFSPENLGIGTEEIEIREKMLQTTADWFESFDSWHRGVCLDYESGERRFYMEHDVGSLPMDFTRGTLRLYVQRKHEYMKEKGLLDFPGLLEQAIAQGVRPPVKYLFLDEAQDNNPLLWKVVEAWGRGCEQVIALGDPDQAIYGWQGADPQQFLDFARGADRIDLKDSFRLPRAIQRISESWISRNRVRMEREFIPRDAEGVVKRDRLMQELPFEDWARSKGSQWSTFVLSRTRRQSFTHKQWLMDRGIPFATNRGAENPLQTPKGRLCYTLIKVFVDNEQIDLQDLSGVDKWIRSKPWIQHGAKKKLADAIKATPERQIGRGDFPELGFKPEFISAVTDDPRRGFLAPLAFTDVEKFYLRRVYDRFGRAAFMDPPKILVTNAHGVKGMEADHVVFDPGLTSYPAQAMMKNPEEERRVCYVGITRAKEGLYVLRPTEYDYYRLF
jgi:superfamily I DNA/RNA helicase